MGCGDANKLLVRKCGLNENLRDRLPILGQVVIAVDRHRCAAPDCIIEIDAVAWL